MHFDTGAEPVVHGGARVTCLYTLHLVLVIRGLFGSEDGSRCAAFTDAFVR